MNSLCAHNNMTSYQTKAFLNSFVSSIMKHWRTLSLLIHTHSHWSKWNAYLVKFARFCVTLAIRVSVRAVRSSGYSCVKLKREGDMMAGHRKRKNNEALIRRSLISGRPRLPHSCLQDANTSLSSRGNTLLRSGELNIEFWWKPKKKYSYW